MQLRISKSKGKNYKRILRLLEEVLRWCICVCTAVFCSTDAKMGHRLKLKCQNDVSILCLFKIKFKWFAIQILFIYLSFSEITNGLDAFDFEHHKHILDKSSIGNIGDAGIAVQNGMIYFHYVL